MTHPTHRSPHAKIDEDEDDEPGSLPIEPDDGAPPPGIPSDPAHDGLTDPEA